MWLAVRGISGRAALWSTPCVAGPVSGSFGTASRWSGTAPCSGHNARWTTSHTRTRPGWTACRSDTETMPAGRRCRNSATPDTECPHRQRTPGTVGRRSKSPCTVPRPVPGSPFPVYLRDDQKKKNNNIMLYNIIRCSVVNWQETVGQ